jgi:hypothetical protein
MVCTSRNGPGTDSTVRAMEVPPPVRLAQDLAPTLRGLDWGIGGSTLLWKLGLAEVPRDLDLVTTAAHFPEVRRIISLKLGDGAVTPHPVYRSRYFARFAPMGPVSVDLFAEVRVETPDGILEWAFDPAALELRDGLPWMRAEDWVQLYRLFDRPTRVKALTDYLARGE